MTVWAATREVKVERSVAIAISDGDVLDHILNRCLSLFYSAKSPSLSLGLGLIDVFGPRLTK